MRSHFINLFLLSIFQEGLEPEMHMHHLLRKYFHNEGTSTNLFSKAKFRALIYQFLNLDSHILHLENLHLEYLQEGHLGGSVS